MSNDILSFGASGDGPVTSAMENHETDSEFKVQNLETTSSRKNSSAFDNIENIINASAAERRSIVDSTLHVDDCGEVLVVTNKMGEISVGPNPSALKPPMVLTSQQAEIHETHAVFKQMQYCGEFVTSDPKSELLILQQINACAQQHQLGWPTDRKHPTSITFIAPRNLKSSAVGIDSVSEQVLFDAPVMTIIFCSRGASLVGDGVAAGESDDDSVEDQHEHLSITCAKSDVDIQSFFAFTCCTTLNEVAQPNSRRFVCHVIRANSRAQVDQILSCFQEAFRRDPSISPVSLFPKPNVPRVAADTSVTFCFEASIEIQERDALRNGSNASGSLTNGGGGTGGVFVNCQVEGGRFFKFRRNAPKKILVQLTQLTPESPRLLIEKCFGILVAVGSSVKSQDFHLLDEVQLFKSGKQVLMNAEWDVPAKKEFEIFCREGLQNKHQNNRLPFKVAVDFVAVGMQAPLRFVIDTGARVLAPNERSWGHAFGSMLGKKHVQEVFYVRTLYVPPAAGQPAGHYDVISINSQSAISRAERQQQTDKFHNLTQPGQKPASDTTDNDASSRISSSDRTNTDGGGTDDDLHFQQELDDEPLMSGCGNIERDISDAEQQRWSETIEQLRDEPATKIVSSGGSSSSCSASKKELEKLIREFDGIPQAHRPEVWQRMAGSFNARELFDTYKTLCILNCGCEAEILKDTSRTFPAHEFFRQSGGEGQEALFRLCKSYALYDSETGYHQSISFIAACLLLQMPEEQAFCLLVKLMYDYKQRELVNNEFYGLRLKYFQLERLIVEKMPHLHAHMQKIALEVHMFASQWFLTMFTAKFPLPLVYRILDIFLLEGEHIMLITAFSLLKLCQNDLMLKNFEESLKYFRVRLPKQFLSEKRCMQLVQLIFALQPSLGKLLRRFETEFEKKCADEAVAKDPLAVLRREFKRVMQHVSRAETENDELANELISTRLALRSQVDKLEDDNERLQLEIGRTRALMDDSVQQESNLQHEVTKIKQLYRELEHDNSSKHASLQGYKQVSSQLSLRLEEEQTKRATMMSIACEPCRAKIQEYFADGAHDPALRRAPSRNEAECLDDAEQHTRELEAELARTKLALVDFHCKNQELEHQLGLAGAEIAERTKNASSSWLQFKFNSIKQSIVPVAAAAGTALPTVVAGAHPALSSFNTYNNNLVISPKCAKEIEPSAPAKLVKNADEQNRTGAGGVFRFAPLN